MAKTKSKVQEAADSIKPYVERAMSDEQLRREVLGAFATAKDLYQDLTKTKNARTAAAKVAFDDDVRDRLREAIEGLQSAADRLQGRKPHGRPGRKGLLIGAVALGILFNPVTGPEARRFVLDLVGGGEHGDGHAHADDSASPTVAEGTAADAG